ncbi:MAG: hypothetical protein N2Z69_01400 [Methylophilaceae bacterium]|nr:hypothetical protein [Methylophilaceae bacterium]
MEPMSDFWTLGIVFSLKKDVPAIFSFLKRKAGKPAPSDLSWIESLPNGNAAAAMEIILDKLRMLVNTDLSSEPEHVSTLYQLGKNCHPYAAVLERQYTSVQKLAPKVDDLIWNALQNYYRYLAKGFQACLDHHEADSAHSGLQPSHLATLILQAMDALCNLARWHAMRYQPTPSGNWLILHRLYALAERLGVDNQYLKLYSGTETTIGERYVRALMLDTTNFTGMQKWEIARVDEWLTLWMKGIVLTRQYNEERHLFYVNLEEDRGARRIRQFHPTDSCRFWETDRIANGIPYFRKLLQKSDKNHVDTTAGTQEIERCQKLLDHLYAEWSRTDYRRQRRRENRNKTAKLAYVVHGMQAVYQWAKEIESSRLHRAGYLATPDKSFEERLSRHTVLRSSAPNVALPWLSGDRWTVQDESANGFGALVDETAANALRVGRLVAAVFDDRKGQVFLGVVRSIRSLSAKEYQVGVEVIARTVAPVLVSVPSTLRGNGLSVGKNPLAAMESLAPALILMENAERENQPASLVMPIANYVAGAILSVAHLNHSTVTVRLEAVLEQQDDWIRVRFST